MKANRGILEAAERLVGAPVRDAVLVQFNYRAAQAVFIPLLVAAIVVATVFDVGVIGYAVGGAVVGITFAIVTKPRFVIGAANGLFLATSTKFPTARPNTVLRELSVTEVSFDGGFINKVATIGGERHLVSRAFVPRLQRLLAETPPPGTRPDAPPGYQPYRTG
jgi:hypothetical protein